MLRSTQVSQKVGNNPMTLSVFSKHATTVNKNSKRYLLADQTRFLGTMYLLRWAALLLSHLLHCSERLLCWDWRMQMLPGVFSGILFLLRTWMGFCVLRLNVLCAHSPLFCFHEIVATCLGNHMASFHVEMLKKVFCWAWSSHLYSKTVFLEVGRLLRWPQWSLPLGILVLCHPLPLSICWT